MFDWMYTPHGEEKIIFGDNWAGPERYEHGKDVLCARYAKRAGDGHAVEVYCCAMPSRFYTIKVLPGPNSCNEMRPGWELGTGSGLEMAALAHQIATAVSDGALDMNTK